MIMVLLMNILTRTVNTYIIRTLSTKHALLVTKPSTRQDIMLHLHTRYVALSRSKHICDKVAQAILTSSSYNKLDLNTALRPYEVI